MLSATHVLGLLQAVVPAGSASPLPDVSPLHMWDWEAPAVRVLGMEDGLTQASVLALLQDEAGFLWVGTQGGLNRYDGHGFRAYRHSFGDSTSLADDYIEALTQDATGIIWVGTNRGGLARMDAAGRFRTFPLADLGPWQPEGLPRGSGRASRGRTVWAIAEDRAGRLLLGTDVGVLAFDPASGEATPLAGQEGIGTRAVLLSQDDLWVGGAAGSVSRYGRDTAGQWQLAARVEVGVDVWSIAIDEAGRLWVGTEAAGLMVLDRERLERVAHPLDELEGIGSVRDIHTADAGRVWVASTEGLLVYDHAHGTHARLRFEPTDRRGLPDPEVRSVLLDRTGTLWIGTWGGLASLPRLHRAILRVPTETEMRGGLTQGAVAIAPAAPGGLWIGTMGGGVNRLELASGAVEAFPADPNDPSRPSGGIVFDLAVSPEGVWVATYGGSINRITEAGRRFERFLLSSMRLGAPEVNAASVFVDATGRVYAGTPESGLQQLVPGTNRFEPAGGPEGPWDLGSDYVWPMVEDAEGSLWVGAHSGGLSRISPDRRSIRRWGVPDGLSDDRILTLLADRDGAIWIGTEGGGLNRFDPASGAFTVYTTRDGLPHDNVEGLLEDDRGFIWVSTNDGLARFDPATQSFWTFREAHGIAGNRFYANAAFKSEHGLLFFGGPEGLTVLDPSLIDKADRAPPVALTAFRINEDEVPLTRALAAEGLELEYEERFFSFSFAALDFTDPTQNRYQYRLDPLQRDWVDAGNVNVANYTSVPPARYTFSVRARNSEGVWNEAGLAIPLIVATPWWQAWWFRAAVAAAIGAMLSALYAYRMHQIQSRQALRLRIASELHNDIGANITAMALKADRSASASEQKKSDYLAQISRLANDAADKLRQTVWVVDTKYDTVAGVVSKLRDTTDLLLGGTVKVRFEAPDPLPNTRVAMDPRQHMYEVYKEVLQNILKHSGANSVHVTVRYDAPHLVLVVRDDGKGFKHSDSRRGSGLDLMKAYASKHKGRCLVRSRPGEGTTVELSMKMR